MTLHPQAKAYLESVAAAGRPSWEELPPDESRRMFETMSPLCGAEEPVAQVTDLKSPTGIIVRLYHPRPDENAPLLVYFHGGGWVIGSHESHDSLCRALASQSGCAVASVHYRRSPEFKFPDPLDDCYAVVTWLASEGVRLRLNADRIGVGGDSAGGNLAAAVALMSRERRGPALGCQVLLYPVMHVACDTTTYQQYADGYGLTRSLMQWFWAQYLHSQEDGLNPFASPLLSDDLTDLPTTLMLTAEYDVLRDEGEQYAARLAEAGVAVEKRRYEGQLHGFMHFAGVFDEGQRARSFTADFIRRALDPTAD